MPNKPRRQALVFVAITLTLSFAFEAWMIRAAGGLRALRGFGVLILMWIPAFVSIGMRLLGREGFRDVGWRAGPWRYWALAFIVPAVFAGFTYLATWLCGGVFFSPKPSELPIASPHLRWLVVAAITGVLGTLLGCTSAFGEELGWRGYLLTRWVEGRLPQPVIATGLIWAVWHLPIILWGDYSTSALPWLSALQFTITITFATACFVWLRLAGGSVWTAMLAHASHNAFYQAVFDAHFNGPLEPYLAGEVGVFSMLAYGALAFWLWKSGRLRRCLEQPVLFAQRADGGYAPSLP